MSLFLATAAAAAHYVSPSSERSLFTILLHVSVGRPRFLFPLGTHIHCHKSLAHTHPLFPIQCWKAQFVRAPCELALLRFVNNIERVGAGGRLE